MSDNSRAEKGRRPRDELGRPLPRHAPNRLPLEDFDSLDLAENDRLGRDYFARGQYFGAHEAWESCWKQARGRPEAEGYKGLAQLAAGYVHRQRGNSRGCRALLGRAIGRLRGYGAEWQDLDLARLIADAVAIMRDLDEPAARGVSR